MMPPEQRLCLAADAHQHDSSSEVPREFSTIEGGWGRRWVIFVVFGVALVAIPIVVGFWNQIQRDSFRRWVLANGGVVKTVPLFTGSLDEVLPERHRDWFWRIDLIAFNDRSFEHGQFVQLVDRAGVGSVRQLYLNGTGIKSTSLKNIGCFSHLEELFLEDTEVNDDTLTDLTQLSNLKVVSLRNTRVTAQGVTRLSQQLPALEILGAENMRPKFD